jgi:small GTP-binding protein
VRLGGIEPSSSVPKTDALSVELQAQISVKIIQQMTDFTQTIEEIEKEIRETPYHKGTEHHIGKLRARLAHLKDRELEYESKKGGGGGGFSVKKQGDATIVLVGPPSVGKSTLVNQLTNAKSKVAEYAFTTVSVIPGMLKYNDAYIQILDVPGLIEGAKEGRGRGKEVLSTVRGADLLLIMSDVQHSELIQMIIKELEKSGIRINQKRPAVHIDKKVSGGIIIHSNIKQEIDNKTIEIAAQEFGLKNAEVIIKEKLSLDALIDSFSSSRVYIPAIFVLNKIDMNSNKRYTVIYQCISAEKGTGLEELKEKIWEKLELIKVYLVRPEEELSFNNPIIMHSNQSLKDVADKIGTEFSEGKKLAKIWGKSAHYPGQEVPLSTPVKEGMQIRFI